MTEFGSYSRGFFGEQADEIAEKSKDRVPLPERARALADWLTEIGEETHAATVTHLNEMLLTQVMAGMMLATLAVLPDDEQAAFLDSAFETAQGDSTRERSVQIVLRSLMGAAEAVEEKHEG